MRLQFFQAQSCGGGYGVSNYVQVVVVGVNDDVSVGADKLRTTKIPFLGYSPIKSGSSRSDFVNVQVTDVVLEKLTSALFAVAKNPRNPQYNNFLFESIAILVKSVCSNCWDPN